MLLRRRYTLNKRSVTKTVDDEGLAKKYKDKGFKVIKTEEIKEDEKEVEQSTEENEKKYICEFCNKEYKTENGLKKHIEREHTEKQEGDN